MIRPPSSARWLEHSRHRHARLRSSKRRPPSRPSALRIAGVFRQSFETLKSFYPESRLQADPTVQYGCASRTPTQLPSCDDFNGEITRAMLDDRDNPYNTYRHSEGLPPGPISNPGKAALVGGHRSRRTTSTTTSWLVGEGNHHFSKTLRQHNIAVRRAQQQAMSRTAEKPPVRQRKNHNSVSSMTQRPRTMQDGVRTPNKTALAGACASDCPTGFGSARRVGRFLGWAGIVYHQPLREPARVPA